MRKPLCLLIILYTFQATAQLEIPFFEQIAFEFYKDTILKKFPLNKRIKIFKYAADSHPENYTFTISSCLIGQTLSEGEELELFSTYLLMQNDWDAFNFEYDYSKIERSYFRVKSHPTNSYNKLLITAPYSKKGNYEIFYLNVIESYKTKRIIYHLSLNFEGQVLNWCRNEEEIIRIY